MLLATTPRNPSRIPFLWLFARPLHKTARGLQPQRAPRSQRVRQVSFRKLFRGRPARREILGALDVIDVRLIGRHDDGHDEGDGFGGGHLGALRPVTLARSLTQFS